MDEQVVVREEDPEAGVRVVPADDVAIGVEPVALAGDLLPGVVGIREARLGIGVVLGLERLGDPDEWLAGGRVDALLAQQDAAQLDRGVAQGVALDGVGGPAVEEDRQVDRRGDLVGQAGVPAVAVGRGSAPARGPSSRRRRCRRRSPTQSPRPSRLRPPAAVPSRPGRRPAGRSPTPPGRRRGRYRKAGRPRGQAAGRPSARIPRRRWRTRAAPARGSSGRWPRRRGP